MLATPKFLSLVPSHSLSSELTYLPIRCRLSKRPLKVHISKSTPSDWLPQFLTHIMCGFPLEPLQLLFLLPVLYSCSRKFVRYTCLLQRPCKFQAHIVMFLVRINTTFVFSISLDVQCTKLKVTLQVDRDKTV